MSVVANMFSVPLGILFGAPVSTCLLHFHRELSSLLTTRIAADDSGVHQEVRDVVSLLGSIGHATDRVETLDHFCRSLIAAYLGNIVGALFVGLPAVYLYLQDYSFTDIQMKDLEEGQQTPVEPISDPASNYGKEAHITETYRVNSKHS